MAADLTAFLCNCFVRGEGGGVRVGRHWVPNTIELRLGGRELSIVQRPEALEISPNKHNGSWIGTTDVVVRDVGADEREAVWALLERLSYLLSFAGCSEVECYGWDHPEDPPIRNMHWRTIARARYAKPTLAIRQPGVVRGYLEGVWPEYSRVEEQRDLRRSIDIFTIAETHGLPMELKLATMFILLENLKSTYAREQGFSFDGRNYLKPSGKPWYFKGLLSEMLKGVGMSQPNLGPIIDLRNEIIHSGVSELSFDEQEEIYGACQDISREYLLRTWGYSGDFQLYGGRGMATKRI